MINFLKIREMTKNNKREQTNLPSSHLTINNHPKKLSRMFQKFYGIINTSQV